MKRVIKYVLMLVLILSMVAPLSCKAAEAPEQAPAEGLPLGEPIRVGCINALSGAFAVWGLYQIQGQQIWADRVNEEGGIIAGGERHMVEMKWYDNPQYATVEELKVAKKAVLDDGCKFIFGTYGKTTRMSTARFLEEHKILTTQYGAGWISPDYRYLMSDVTGSPAGFLPLAGYIASHFPEVKRAAILTTDCYQDQQGWFVAAMRAAGFEIVYNELYPFEITDFHPLLTSVLATEPDVILENATPSQGVYYKTLVDMGYTGYFLTACGDWERELFETVPREYFEGKLYYSFWADYEDPFWPEQCYDLYERYVAEYGEWCPTASEATSCPEVILGVGIPAADSIDPTDVMEALYAMSEIDHPTFGRSVWGGMEVFGCNQALETPVPITTVQGGEKRTITTLSYADYFNEHKDVIMAALDEYGILYHP